MLRCSTIISIAILCCFIPSDSVDLQKFINNSPDDNYFSKYEPCAISISRLHDAYSVEEELVEAIQKGLDIAKYDKKLTKEHEEIDKKIARLMQFIMEEREKENNSTDFMNHPVNTLHFLIRTVTEFNPLFNQIFTSQSLKKRNFYRDLSILIDRYIREKSSCWPTVEDLYVAASGIARMTYVFSLSKDDLINGTIFGQHSRTPLSVDDILLIAQQANKQSFVTEVLEWTDLIFDRYRSVVSNNDLIMRSIIRMRANALSKNDKIQEAIKYLETSIKEVTFDVKSLQRDLQFYQAKLTENIVDADKNRDSEKHLNSLCQGLVKTSSKGGLRCYYRRLKSGWDHSKIEVLSQNPPLYKFYSLINKREITAIFDILKNKKINVNEYTREPNTLIDKKQFKENVVIWDEDYETMRNLGRRISYVSGLCTKTFKFNPRISSSGPFHVLNYGVGGFSDLQVDYLSKNKDKKEEVSVFGGDRLATWIFQLKQSTIGGNIVFPKINVSIPLETGTGLLWFNLFRNGTTNPLVEHAECPTVLGSKWVIKKFIHENGNMFNRKCWKKGRSYFY